MTARQKLLLDFEIVEMAIRQEEHEILEMSRLEIATALEADGINPAAMVQDVCRKTSAMKKNAEIAKRMNIERSDVRKRALILTATGALGLALALAAFIIAAFFPHMSEAARKLVVLILVGGSGLFLLSLLATLFVVWNAFVYSAILAEVASEETSCLLSDLEEVEQTNPTATADQILTVVRQSATWERYHPAV